MMRKSPKLLLGASGLAMALALGPVIAQQTAPSAPPAPEAPAVTAPVVPTEAPANQPVVGTGNDAAALTAPETPAKQAQVMPDSFADLVEQVSPAVVNITTTSVVSTPARDNGAPELPPGSPFGDLFRDFGGPGGPFGPGGPGQDGQGGQGNDDQGQRPSPFGNRGGPQRSQALGSGFVISADGYVITNNHVIDGADSIEVEFKDGDKRTAKVVGTDPKTDIALLKVEGSDLPFVKFGDSDSARVGDWVLALGNPLGQGFSATSGIVSARNRELTGTYDDFIQTDASINRGNSGGPLFNMDGEVIGVNTAILSPNGGSIGIGFSMASNVVAKVAEQLEEFGETRRGWLGVQIQDVTPEMADALDLAEGQGAMITDVPQGPAADAGMQSGDVVVTFDGQPVKDSRDLVRRVADAPIGQAVPLVVERKGQKVDLNVTLGRRELAENEGGARGGQGGGSNVGDAMGMSVATLTPDVAAELGAPRDLKGLVVQSVDPEGAAADKGIAAGDVITEVGQQPVSTPADLQKQIAAAKEAGRKSVLVLLRRDGAPRFVALPIDKG